VRAALDLLAGRAPGQEHVVRAATRLGLSFWDGTVVRVDHVTQDQTNCSWNHKRHGVIEQILADYQGRPQWAPAALPGSIHGLTAARRHGVIDLLVDADLPLAFPTPA